MCNYPFLSFVIKKIGSAVSRQSVVKRSVAADVQSGHHKFNVRIWIYRSGICDDNSSCSLHRGRVSKKLNGGGKWHQLNKPYRSVRMRTCCIFSKSWRIGGNCGAVHRNFIFRMPILQSQIRKYARYPCISTCHNNGSFRYKQYGLLSWIYLGD